MSELCFSFSLPASFIAPEVKHRSPVQYLFVYVHRATVL